MILLLNQQPNLKEFFNPSINDEETLKYIGILCQTDTLPQSSNLNKSFIYAVYLLLKSNKRDLIEKYIKSNKFNSNELSRLLSLPTDERLLIKAKELNSILPTEAFLVEIVALMTVLPPKTLNYEAKKCLNKMVDAEKRNSCNKASKKAGDPESADERIRLLIDELNLSKRVLCQKAQINPKTYEAAMTAYLQPKKDNKSSSALSDGKVFSEPQKGFDFKSLHQIASALNCSISYLRTGESEYYSKSEYDQTKIVRNPFEPITDEQADILEKAGTLSNQLYICRIIANLFKVNRFFTTVAIEYYRRGQPKKIIEFIYHMQNLVPKEHQEHLTRLRQGQFLKDLFTKNI